MSNDIPPEVCKTLKRLVHADEENVEIAFYDPNKKGEGFSGEVIFVTLRDKKTRTELNVIVKQAFRQHSIRDSLPVRDAYKNEIYFYSKIWPTFDKFQAQLPMKYRFQKLPKCLATVSNDNFEYLVMENLKFQHFRNHDKKLPLSKEYFELILYVREYFPYSLYGKFHALSFAYKALHPKEYADLPRGLLDLFFSMAKSEFFQKGIKYAYEICVESLQPGVDDAIIEKLRPYIQNFKDVLVEIMERKSKYTVITHADCWSSNMMFKYDDSNKVTDVRFLDFQAVRVTSPCCDLSYCIYAGATGEVLKNLDYYLQVYHNSLSETLKQFGCDPQELYPMQALKEDWKIFCKFGFTMALPVWKLKFSYENELKTFADIEGAEGHEQILQTSYDKDGFSKGVKDLLCHLYENDFL